MNRSVVVNMNQTAYSGPTSTMNDNSRNLSQIRNHNLNATFMNMPNLHFRKGSDNAAENTIKLFKMRQN